ncbi:MAG: hypothetical protein E6Q69_07950 [Aquipseudomonas alcaligenes]|uniref:MATE family efflux transporter n=1 Tax=Aquipseudomonas alcaligenes TaxID=43263 RepID=A0A5C7W8P5_AQUAC|nr:MAG: hypothetical protein E6Q69_07950 [Pseudomonas alcaligenes]
MSILLDAWRHTPTHRKVWALAAPMILSNLSVPLVTLVDTAVIGHLPHTQQLGAVVVGGSLYAMLVGVFGILRMSATGFAAQAVGRGDGGALRQVLLQSLVLAALIALLVGLLAIPLSGVALHLVFFLITVQGTRLGDATVAANALLLNGLLVAAFALDGLAHAVEALCGHAIGARDRLALRRALLVAGGWSLLGSLLFALLFLLGGRLFIELQSDIAEVRNAAYPYLPYLALLPLIAVWSYLLDGLFIGATRAREMRDAMLVSVALGLIIGALLQDLGNHGLWLALLCFMLMRGLSLAILGWRLQRQDAWLATSH